MDYTNYNIIKIIPGVYIGDSNAKYCENELTKLNIHYLININKTLNGISFTTYNININSNIEYIDSSQPINIDLNATNEFIITALQNNLNILICDINYLIPILIVGAFLIKYLNISYMECVYWLSKKTNLSIISKNICYQLFLYYKENDYTS
jgi:hypothetical protein